MDEDIGLCGRTEDKCTWSGDPLMVEAEIVNKSQTTIDGSELKPREFECSKCPIMKKMIVDEYEEEDDEWDEEDLDDDDVDFEWGEEDEFEEDEDLEDE